MARHLIPHSFGRDFWDLFDFPETLVNQNFGIGVPVEDFIESNIRPTYLQCPVFRRPRHQQQRLHRKSSPDETGCSLVKNDEAKFEVKLDCSHFAPEELSVKVVDNGLVISGKHEEKKDEHGYITRQFTRRYVLPKDVVLESITSSLDGRGVLTLTAPKKQPEAIEGNERSIPISVVPCGGGGGPVAAPAATVVAANGTVDKEMA